MINSFVITTLATEGEPIQDVPEQNNGTEELNNDMQLIEKSDIITDTYGRIIEARSPREIQSGTVKDRVQDVKVEIIEGEYIWIKPIKVEAEPEYTNKCELFLQLNQLQQL